MKSVVLFTIFIGLLAGNLVAAPDADKPFVLSLPGMKWALEIKAPGFAMKEFSISPDGQSTYFQASNKKTGVIMSAFLEKAEGANTPQACRKYYWSKAVKSPFKKAGIKMSESGNMAMVEYTIIQKYKELDFSQRNLNVYMAESGYWIDIHLSKSEFKPADKKLFKAVLDGVSIKKNFQPDSLLLFCFGSLYYEQDKFTEAIPYLQKALDLENKKRELNKNTWLLLIDRLGISYGVSGNLNKAEAIYKAAIKKEPEYPQFYYNLACAYAEKNNLDGAIKNLKLAFKYRKNMLPGLILCDPKEDSSFKKFMNNQRFKAALKEMDQDK